MKFGLMGLAGLTLGVTESFGCAVCGGPLSPRTLNAYVIMTLILSLFPFLMLGTGIWIYHRFLHLAVNSDDRRRVHPG